MLPKVLPMACVSLEKGLAPVLCLGLLNIALPVVVLGFVLVRPCPEETTLVALQSVSCALQLL